MYVYAFLLLLGYLRLPEKGKAKKGKKREKKGKKREKKRLPEFLPVFISPPEGSHSPLSSPDFPLRWKGYFYSYKFTLKQEQ